MHVDFETLVRTLKDSAAWYAEVIRTKGEALGAKKSGTDFERIAV